MDATFWVAIAFAIFAVVFAKLAWPALTKLLDGRADAIRSELEEAQKQREEAQTTLAAYQKRQREVMEDAERILEQAKTEADTMKAAAEEKLAQEVDRRVKLANDKISRAQNQAMQAVQKNVVAIAVSAAHTLISDQLEAANDDELITLAIDDIERIVH